MSQREPPALDQSSFVQAIGASQLAMMVTDPTAGDNPIVYVNPAFERLTGYAADEAIGRNPRFMQGPDTAPEAIDAMRDGLSAGREVSVDVLNYRKDGRAFWNAVYISPVRDHTGRVINYFGTQFDTTARKRAELALERAKEELEATIATRTQALTDMLAEKSALLNELDHRVRNNLQLILSIVKLQSRRTAEPDAVAALASLLGRVSALSTAHRHLFVTHVERFEVADFVRDLVQERGGPEPSNIEALRLQPVNIPAANAGPLALALGDMLSWAACGDPADLKVQVERDDGHFHIVVEAPNKHMAPDPFGREVIDVLARQLLGQTRFDEAEGVRRACLSLPVEGVRA